MNVAELISELKGFPPEMPVVIAEMEGVCQVFTEPTIGTMKARRSCGRFVRFEQLQDRNNCEVLIIK